MRRLTQVIVSGTGHVEASCEACRHLAKHDDRHRLLSRRRGQITAERRHAESQLRFLESMMRVVDTTGSMDCGVCLKDVDVAHVAVLPCGHCFHVACAGAAVARKGCCPQCRRSTTAQLIIPVAEQLGGQTPVTPLRAKYGSKLTQVVQTIQDIQLEEGDVTKCVIFVQWESIVSYLASYLGELGIPPLVLRGTAGHRQKVLSSFVDGLDKESSVLVLSLEQSPTGMNLMCAHHLLLVHPMYAERSEDAVEFEMQAIGRVRRQGQTKTVHVHRFVTQNTIEPALARFHRSLCTKRAKWESREARQQREEHR